MSGEALQTSLGIALAQITDGDAECECGKPAVVTIATGADPDPEPYCWADARGFMLGMVAVSDQLWGDGPRLTNPAK